MTYLTKDFPYPSSPAPAGYPRRKYLAQHALKSRQVPTSPQGVDVHCGHGARLHGAVVRGFVLVSQLTSLSLHSTERCFTPEPQVTEHCKYKARTDTNVIYEFVRVWFNTSNKFLIIPYFAPVSHHPCRARSDVAESFSRRFVFAATSATQLTIPESAFDVPLPKALSAGDWTLNVKQIILESRRSLPYFQWLPCRRHCRVRF